MAHTAQSWQELIPDVFCPHIAVMCTKDAEAACKKNNLTFVEMMRPFCQLTCEAHVRDAHNQPHVVKNLRLRFSEPSSEVPSMGATKQTMHNTVLKAQPSGAIVPGSTLQVGNLTLNVLTPWFESYRKQYIQLMRVSDHEYLRHYVGCLFVVSTSHARPMDAFIDLQKKQQDMAKEKTYPKWLTPYVFNYYLLLHDSSRGEEDNAHSIFQSMKAAFGQFNSHLLRINSRSPDASMPDGMPDPWGQYVNRSDSTAAGDELADNDLSRGGSSLTNHNDASAPASVAGTPNHATLEDISKADADDTLTGSSAMSDPLSQALADPLSAQAPAVDTADDSPISVQGTHINVRVSSSAVPTNFELHGQFLTVSDHDRLRIFVNEFAVRGLIPHIERSIRALTDQVNSKKGIQRTLYSATKKWFGSTNKPVIMQGQSYSADAAELQSRKLADLAFLVQLYETAYSWYHTAKRDFHNDNAMLHYAGAVEMAALSLFMQGAYRRDPQAYFEEAINNYESVCKSHQFALRSTLLFFEFLKFRGLYKEAATALIRMTSDETDLAAALLTEQAAICYLRMNSPMIRKYAMHMLLAGHRFKKAYQRQHALRAYSLALQVYQTKGWWIAEDHMNFIIGRLAIDLHELNLGQESFHQLLAHRSRLIAPTQQSLYLQEFLLATKKFLLKSDKAAMEKSQLSTSSCVDIANLLPLARFPRIDAQLTRVILPGVADSTKLMTPDVDVNALPEEGSVEPAHTAERQAADDEEGKREELWLCMEELAARFTLAESDSAARNGYLSSTPSGFVWDVRLFGPHTDNSQYPRCALGERVMVEIVLTNDLQIPLSLTGISLMWQLFPVSLSSKSATTAGDNADEAVLDEDSEPVICNSVPDLIIAPRSSQPVCLSLTPQREGKLHILGVVYNIVETTPPKEGGRARSGTQRESLASGLRFRQEIEPRGHRLNLTKDQRCSVMYGPDRRLQLAVYPPMPLLKIEFDNVPTMLLCGEVHHCIVKLTNVGCVALRRLRAVCPESQQIVWGDVKKRVPERSGIYSTVGQSTPSNGSSTAQSCELRDKVWPCFPLAASSAFTGSSPAVTEADRARVCDIDLPSERLEPGSSVEVDCWIRGGALPGRQTIDTLMYFDVDGDTAFTHRVLRHTNHIQVSESIRIAARARQSVATPTPGCDRNQLLVSVDVENLSQADAVASPKFTVNQIVGVSSQFTMSSLQKDNFLELSSRETAYIHLKASHLPVDDGRVYVSDVSFMSDDQVDSLAIPCLELFGQDSVAKPFAAAEPDHKVAERKNRSPAAMQPAPTHHPPVPASIATPIGIIVLWQACVPDGDGGSRQAYGQYHMLLESLESPVSSVTAQSAMVSSFSASLRAGMEGGDSTATSTPDLLLVKGGMLHADKVRHDFTVKRLCILPVELSLHNSHDADVEVEVLPRAPSAAGTADTEQQASPSKPKAIGSAAYAWVGCTHSKLQLKKGADSTVRLNACFTRPGFYNLANVRLRVRKLPGDGSVVASGPIEQRPLPPSLLVLEETTSSG
eukprot:scpid5573/ scgid3607/ Trafficking protein particle complex subunit 8; Protein TRS85 homolog